MCWNVVRPSHSWTQRVASRRQGACACPPRRASEPRRQTADVRGCPRTPRALCRLMHMHKLTHAPFVSPASQLRVPTIRSLPLRWSAGPLHPLIGPFGEGRWEVSSMSLPFAQKKKKGSGFRHDHLCISLLVILFISPSSHSLRLLFNYLFVHFLSLSLLFCLLA